jgi:hypothetical protein
MNKNYIVYGDSGSILQTGSVPDTMLQLQASPGRNVIEGVADIVTDYVKRNVMVDDVPIDVVVPRPVNPTTLSGTTLSNVPVPARIRINSTYYDTNEATAELGLPALSTYTVTVMAFPYLDKTFTVTT